LVGFNQPPKKAYYTKWVITKGGSISVVGSTNVNKFSCAIADYYKPDTLTFYQQNSSTAFQITGSLALDVQHFDCHNPPMTANLRKALKAKEFPYLTITFISLNRYPANLSNTETLKGLVTIALAGVSKRYEINYRITPNGKKALTLEGTRQVNFSDFNIVPPRKIGGMIQTDNALQVKFNLNVKVLDYQPSL
jgi:hypothetical protein